MLFFSSKTSLLRKIMTDSISQEQAQEMLRWLNKNRDTVLDLHKNQYIAYNRPLA
jgi:predicted deacylase